MKVVGGWIVGRMMISSVDEGGIFWMVCREERGFDPLI